MAKFPECLHDYGQPEPTAEERIADLQAEVERLRKLAQAVVNRANTTGSCGCELCQLAEYLEGKR